MTTTESASAPAVRAPVPGAAPLVASDRPSRLWTFLLGVARILVALFCRSRVTGQVPAQLRGGAVLLASNHIGLFDPIALAAACSRQGLEPRYLATAGLFRAPVLGGVLRRCRHIPVDRRGGGAQALDHAHAALLGGAAVVAYPEGRISLDPGLWPERPKTGVARLALATGTPVVPVAQWGAHEVMAWGGFFATVRTALRALVRRPVVRVHFGAPVDLSGLSAGTPGDAQRAADRIAVAMLELLVMLRRDEPDLPRFLDRTRPLSTTRSYPRR